MKEKITLFWFRRDLRLDDNRGLFEALQSGLKVLPIFIFDTVILDKLENKQDARVQFIQTQVTQLNEQLKAFRSGIQVFHGKPKNIFHQIIDLYQVKSVYLNKDYEPYARERDVQIKALCGKNNIEFRAFKDQVIFEESEIVKDDATPYTVFTPFSKKWKKVLNDSYLKAYNYQPFAENFYHFNAQIPSLEAIGFKSSAMEIPEPKLEIERLQAYADNRDIPEKDATTKLGIHLRFGTVSTRQMVKKARDTSETFLNELIWREFFMQILYHFPHVENGNFRSKYDQIAWRNNEQEFKKWCAGKTGYPLVDAGMRELNTTGFMHNRVRMLTASFLTKHLLIDWRWGEAYFAEKLLDYELASNNGNWQWAAGTGCDAAPYFRIFNPTEQQKKFDPQAKYIKKWISEFDDLGYPHPIVDHKMARERTLSTYKAALDTSY
ncbi:MAG: deoxyribodipyrimidine photo-lyase [Bacteroidales bacterium]|jgi:deoxyribodipyrimidine photo-lyase|nr:deoxyribodipyrimidine photo-lyase [Bacteroidales bacterium]